MRDAVCTLYQNKFHALLNNYKKIQMRLWTFVHIAIMNCIHSMFPHCAQHSLECIMEVLSNILWEYEVMFHMHYFLSHIPNKHYFMYMVCGVMLFSTNYVCWYTVFWSIFNTFQHSCIDFMNWVCLSIP